MIYYCMGMPSSASTWAYNVVRSILQAGHVEHIAFRGETFGDFMRPMPTGPMHAVIKGHRAETSLLPILKLCGVKPLLTVRDPRDATTSLVQRFELNAGAAAMQMNRSVANLITAANSMPHIVFYFEDRPSEQVESVAEIANFLGVQISVRQIEEIFDKFKVESVKAFISNIDKLPKDRQKVESDRNVSDRDTQFHKTHITDMKIGKWASHFDAETAGQLERLFGDYARFFESRGLGTGVETPHTGVPSALEVEFSSNLFRPVNSIDQFIRQLPARDVVNQHGMRVLEHIYVPSGQWDMRCEVDLPAPPRALRALQLDRVIAQTTNSRTLEFSHDNLLSGGRIDLYAEFDGMRDFGDAAPAPAKVVARRRA